MFPYGKLGEVVHFRQLALPCIWRTRCIREVRFWFDAVLGKCNISTSAVASPPTCRQLNEWKCETKILTRCSSSGRMIGYFSSCDNSDDFSKRERHLIKPSSPMKGFSKNRRLSLPTQRHMESNSIPNVPFECVSVRSFELPRALRTKLLFLRFQLVYASN